MNLNDVNDPTGGHASEGYDALPNGPQVMALVKATVGPTRNDPESVMVSAEFQVMNGNFQGRRVWETYNLKNASDKAMEMGWGNWNALLQACGKLRVSVPDEIYGIPFIGNLGVRKDDPSRNKINSYKPLNGGGAPANTGGHVQQGAAAGGGNAPPWLRRG